MGFKDLANFNDALLAKQAWRLLHNKNSLFYRVFKLKFFPNCSILEATNSISGSNAWQSILKGRDVLLTGAKWRVGCGESISVWNDAWLSSLDCHRIQSQIVPSFVEAKVSELINPTTRRGDINLLRGLFHPAEVDIILRIPLSPSPVEDKVIWPFNPSSVYSVRLGSKFLAKESTLSALQVNQHQREDIWKRIWSLLVPNKVRNLLRLACHDAIPVKRNLWKRKIFMKDVCEHCLLAPETIFHALWECAKISEVWEAIPGCAFRQMRIFPSIRELIDFGSSEGKNMELMVMVMWTI